MVRTGQRILAGEFSFASSERLSINQVLNIYVEHALYVAGIHSGTKAIQLCPWYIKLSYEHWIINK